ncbi:MAG TPA: hypothetical protein G4O04_04760 [Anaerolineae bacterium]|nr:hypothetical protein [Anaerolineae bacterium]HID83863.1 hypothetical protein [Anaerolineales bacterium]HIQ08916.1 hypothetical protein [Anaerolineaceae bacterium]
MLEKALLQGTLALYQATYGHELAEKRAILAHACAQAQGAVTVAALAHALGFTPQAYYRPWRGNGLQPSRKLVS